jgi:hypothetical protein
MSVDRSPLLSKSVPRCNHPHLGSPPLLSAHSCDEPGPTSSQCALQGLAFAQPKASRPPSTGGGSGAARLPPEPIAGRPTVAHAQCVATEIPPPRRGRMARLGRRLGRAHARPNMDWHAPMLGLLRRPNLQVSSLGAPGWGWQIEFRNPLRYIVTAYRVVTP